MKKMMLIALVLACLLGLSGCSEHLIDTTKPVFETEKIDRITLFAVPSHTEGIEVPSEYMDEITAWIGTFTIDKKADDLLPPGTNTFAFRIEYADGTIVESGVNATTIGGITYYMKQGQAPECLDTLLAVAKSAE